MTEVKGESTKKCKFLECDGLVNKDGEVKLKAKQNWGNKATNDTNDSKK